MAEVLAITLMGLLSFTVAHYTLGAFGGKESVRMAFAVAFALVVVFFLVVTDASPQLV